jgi:S-adenosylmethionine/arginine decarboxylase-like enzyme
MFHYMIDAHNGYRSRLDDVLLVHEFLDEIPVKLGIRSVMPPFVLPYFNGVVPEDCGISAFVFLSGGHLTLHTFSYRGAFFVDLVYPGRFDRKRLRALIGEVFPAEKVLESFVNRTGKERIIRPAIDVKQDFGPHLMLNVEDYSGPATLGDVFEYLDRLPPSIGMTPIIRPYVVKSLVGEQEVVSGMAMIAESHIGLHVFPKSRKAFFDIFSCTFFDTEKVLPEIKNKLKGRIARETLISRGSKHKTHSETPAKKLTLSRAWVNNVYAGRPKRRI